MRRLVLTCLLLAACGGTTSTSQPERSTAPRPQALSLFGRPLYPAPQSEAVRSALTAQLDSARAAYEANPADADAIIWLGRRHAYLGDYREAIEVFTEGIAKHPRDARMYRHRGHRFITTRQFSRAITDLTRAAELVEGTPDQVEPDGAPNRFNIPTSTLHSNIWYHLALAHYLRHDFAAALPAWQRAVAVSTNDDMLVASSDWLYMTLRRLGRRAEADAVLERITPDMRILENDAYHRRLLMYKGLVPADSLMPLETEDPVQLATYGYGLANWYQYNGDWRTAERLFRRILEGSNWAAFGFIAAEAEIAGTR
ncbi:MAG TPA: tetratricopeptide repeat protein [Longimicrobiales bacterium]|nr:tetratricopeptide repeat protein [Longimicrobiales bacterium]